MSRIEKVLVKGSGQVLRRNCACCPAAVAATAVRSTLNGLVVVDLASCTGESPEAGKRKGIRVGVVCFGVGVNIDDICWAPLSVK